MVNSQTGEPLTVEFLTYDPHVRALSSCPTSRRWSGSASTVSSARGRPGAVPEPAAHASTSTSPSTRLGASRSRPATSSATSGARQAADRPGSRNLVGHQGPGHRRADREGDLRQGPRRARRRHQGARPRAARARLRGAAMDARRSPAPRAGTASAGPATLPRYGGSRLPDDRGGTIAAWPRRPERRDDAASPGATVAGSAPAPPRGLLVAVPAAQAGAAGSARPVAPSAICTTRRTSRISPMSTRRRRRAAILSLQIKARSATRTSTPSTR